MNEIEKILKKIGSNKVDWVKLGDVCTFTRGKPLSSSDTIPGDVPVVSGGQKPSFYHNRPNRVRNTITVAGSGASAGFVSYWEIPIWVADAFTVDPYEKLTLKYVYYFLKNNQEKIYRLQKGAGVPHVHGNDIAGIKIPVPRVPIQNWIVLILDSFTTLIDKMKQEVVLRKKQMEYYREKLICEQNYPLKAIGKIGEIDRGSGLQKKDFTESGIGCIHYGQIYTRLNSFCDKTLTFVTPKLAERLTKVHPGDLVIACTSENIEDVCKSVVWLGEEDIVTGGHACVLRHKENPKYISYCFQTAAFALQKAQFAYGAKVIDIKTDNIKKIEIPVPSPSTQRSIVSTLDTFEQYISKLERLITLREKQYAYYREKLLTFE